MRRRNESAILLPKTAGDRAAELPGVVLPQWVRCGKPSCRCASGTDLHGPYYYRFWREGGRLRKRYVPRARLEETSAACERRRAEVRRARDSTRGVRSLLSDFRALAREVERASALWRGTGG